MTVNHDIDQKLQRVMTDVFETIYDGADTLEEIIHKSGWGINLVYRALVILQARNEVIRHIPKLPAGSGRRGKPAYRYSVAMSHPPVWKAGPVNFVCQELVCSVPEPLDLGPEQVGLLLDEMAALHESEGSRFPAEIDDQMGRTLDEMAVGIGWNGSIGECNHLIEGARA